MSDGVLRAYMVFDRLGGSEDCAVLVYARNAKEARTLGYATLYGYCSDCLWVDCTTRWLRSGAPYYRDPYETVAHVVEPDVCDHCEYWFESGLDKDGLCESCAEFSVSSEPEKIHE